MKEPGELLFLLSSVDRINILSAIGEKRLKQSQLASKFSMTTQETSRQLARLSDAKLVEKDPQGQYGLTGLGNLAMQLLPSFGFLVRRSEYLLSHDLSFLPPEFIERVGELSEGRYMGGLGSTLDHINRVLRESREHIWLMADQVLVSDAIHAKLSQDRVSWRIVVPAASAPQERYPPFPSELRGRIEVGLVEEVRVAIALNEGLAGLAFADRKGKIDFDTGLQGSDPQFLKWCADLFTYYWSKAKRVL
jgi:predicted transcriptional regulator